MRIAFSILLISSSVLVACDQPVTKDPADIVLLNGGIYTVDAGRSWAEAAAIDDGIIVAVGSNSDIKAYVGADTEVVDLAGRMAMPGIHDAHIHPLEGAYEQVNCDVYPASSVDQIVSMLAGCASRLEGEWLNAMGLDWSLFPVDGPDNSMIAGIADDKFIFVDGLDGHSALVNDKVLDLVGFDETTADPPRGVIERRAGTQEPSGTVREEARHIIDALRPKRDLATSVPVMRDVVDRFNSLGITSVFDVWIGEHEMQVYQALDQAGDLTVRVKGAVIDEGVFEKHSGDDFERVLRERSAYESDLIDYNSIKIMVDGVFEGETAATVEPYINVDHHGTLNHSAAELGARVARYYNDGMHVYFHAMGDGGARAALDAIELARDNGAPELLENRHTISHLGLIDPADYARFAELNTGANFTMVWAPTSEWTYQLEIPVIGMDRVRRLYPIRSIDENDGVVLGGSDWNYGDLEPLLSIESAVTRTDPYGPAPESDFDVLSDELVSLATMIEAYTINGAWQLGLEDVSGSIETGKRADVVVYDRNLFEIDPYEISEALVDLTVFDGRVVYRRDDD